MIRAVLDVNVLISALISPSGTPAKILDLWRDETFLVVTSDLVLNEFQTAASRPVMSRRYGLTPSRLQALVHGLRRFAIVVPGQLHVTGVARDPDDDKLLACAVEGNADYVVTGDDDLLELGEYEQIPILSPADFVRALKHE